MFGSSSSRPGASCRLLSCAFVLSTLGALAGCGENVLVGNWQLRSLADAGAEPVAEADAAPNEQAVHAEAARVRERVKSEQRDKDGHDKGSNDDEPGH